MLELFNRADLAEGWKDAAVAGMLATSLVTSPVHGGLVPYPVEQVEISPINMNMDVIEWIESKHKADAHNKSEDGRGLYQINPITLKEWNNFHPNDQHTPEDLFDPRINTKIADWYMLKRIPQMVRHYGRKVTLENMIIAWNAGIKYVKDGGEIPKSTLEYIEKYKNKVGM